MNMVGAPKHVAKCLDAGVDLICAQGGEGIYQVCFPQSYDFRWGSYW
jgi:hypothetical protein